MLTIHVRYNNTQCPRTCVVCGETHRPVVGFVAFVGGSDSVVCDCCVESADAAFHHRMKSLWREVEEKPFHMFVHRTLLSLTSPRLHLLSRPTVPTAREATHVV